MKNNLVRQSCSDSSDWKKLLEKYYEGTTTGEEEKKLRQFLLTQESNKEYCEDLATMAYTATGQALHQLHRKKAASQTSLRNYLAHGAIAAAFIGIIIGYFTLQNKKDEYIVYIHGEKYTQSEIVLKEMRQSLAGFENTEISVEQELSYIFGQPADEQPKHIIR